MDGPPLVAFILYSRFSVLYFYLVILIIIRFLSPGVSRGLEHVYSTVSTEGAKVVAQSIWSHMVH